jgi:hypothetical protein
MQPRRITKANAPQRACYSMKSMWRRLKRILGLALLWIAGTSALIYAADYGVFRLRVAAKRNPYGSVTVEHYYAVPQKSGKTEFIFDPPQPQTCVHALVPHGGDPPCWYLARHPEQRTNI